MNTIPGRSFRLNKYRFLTELVRESLLTPMRGVQLLPRAAGAGEAAITWIGHSSFLLQLAGKHILIDPVFTRFLIVLKRRRKPGIALRDLPPIDLVLLTHAHMDHLNLPSLRGILRSNRRYGVPAPIVIVPKGVEDLVNKLPFREIHMLEPWTSATFGALTVTMTPARHWGARMFDDVGRGYGGYVVQAEGHFIYHSGDTAYFPGFAAIGERLHPQVALLPIGAYSPDSFRSVHTSPEDALQAFQDLGSKLMIPMHYGTFRLSQEPMDEPPVRLLAAAAKAGLSSRVLVLEEGQTHVLPPL